MGQNLLTLHGLYYSTHGGWWEWAPPCNHFRMPYWPHMGALHGRASQAAELPAEPGRASLRRGDPVSGRADGGRHGRQGSRRARPSRSASTCSNRESISTSSISSRWPRAQSQTRNCASRGERTACWCCRRCGRCACATLQKARASSTRPAALVIAVGALPEASDRAGAKRSRVGRTGEGSVSVIGSQWRAGRGEHVESVSPRFFRFAGVLHRKVGVRDIYLVCGVPHDAECSFRARAKWKLRDPWTGQPQPLPIVAQLAQGTRLRLPLTEQESQLIVFSPGTPQFGDSVRHVASESIELSGDWEFELKPTMDNRFGDFRWPPTDTVIGAEARRFRYAGELADGTACPSRKGLSGGRILRLRVDDDQQLVRAEVFGSSARCPRTQTARCWKHSFRR